MGIIRAFSDAVSGTLADQWREVITAEPFDEHVVVAPGVQREDDRGRGSNSFDDEGVITNGSRIFVPEGTAAFIFHQASIEDIITQPGEYVYTGGQGSVFNGDGFGTSIVDQVAERMKYGGVAPNRKQVAFVNLREIRDIKFGTRGPQIYHDKFYGVDLEVRAYGRFSVQISDVQTFVTNFLPAGVYRYSFDDRSVRSQIVSELVQSFIVALNTLSEEYRVSQIPSQAARIAQEIAADSHNAGTWPDRFGFGIRGIAIEEMRLTKTSRELIQQYSERKMAVSAYEDVSQQASDRAAQQTLAQGIAQGIKDNGFGDGGGMMLGVGLAQSVGQGVAGSIRPVGQSAPINEQIELLKQLKELLDAGILSVEEFEKKKREVLG